MYRLITRNSYEREMLDKASLKLGLDRAVLQSMSGNKDSNVNGVRTSQFYCLKLSSTGILPTLVSCSFKKILFFYFDLLL